MKNIPESVDVLVIGAGPSGSIASALLYKYGRSVVVLEKAIFPRFSIGESLLPQCMEYIKEAGMMDAVVKHQFQYKNGAAFAYKDKRTVFDFGFQFTEGWGHTWQVQRAQFDKVLADSAEEQGVPIFYEHEITEVDCRADGNLVTYRTPEGEVYSIRAKFVLDASGFGRVLPRLLNLEKPSSFPPRKALFTHVIDHIDDDEYDRNKILICVNPENRAIWYWLIPFSNGTVSLGVVGEPKFIDSAPGENLDKLKSFVVAEPRLRELLRNAEYHTRVGEITGYAADVDSLHGPGYALLGNAGEFLDPVFSSGVTIAMRSGHLAAHLLEKQFSGETVDWVSDYDQALRLGIKTFKNFVTTWYDGSFQDVIFGVSEDTDVKKMICSILAGYAWDTRNPYVSESDKRLRVLTELCRSE